MSVIQLTKDNFKDELSKVEGRALVDFYATWCGPCQAQGPIIEEVAEESSANIFSIDIDEQPELAAEFGVSSIPTLIVFEKGEEIDRKTGLTPKSTIAKMLGAA